MIHNNRRAKRGGRRPAIGKTWVIGIVLWLGVAPGVSEEEKSNQDHLAGQPAELSAWAYAIAPIGMCRIPRKPITPSQAGTARSSISAAQSLAFPRQREEAVADPVLPYLLSDRMVGEQGAMLPPPNGVLQSALLWEGRMQLIRLELHWPSAPAGAGNGAPRGKA